MEEETNGEESTAVRTQPQPERLALDQKLAVFASPILDGDTMGNPEITFTVDKQNCSIHPTSFLQDNVRLFYETAQAKPSMVQDLKDFMSQWLTNIVNQGFESEKVSVYASEEEEDER